MNETIQSILERRSIRKYLPLQIKKDELEVIIKCAIYAPSSNNEQNWHFTVIQNSSLLNSLNDETKELMAQSNSKWASDSGKDKDFHIFYNAPTAVLISGEKDSSSSKINCTAAAENMMIAAQSIGIGSCWIGVVGMLFINEIKFKALDIKLPEGYAPLFMIALGYPDPIEDVKVPARKENAVDFIK